MNLQKQMSDFVNQLSFKELELKENSSYKENYFKLQNKVMEIYSKWST